MPAKGAPRPAKGRRVRNAGDLLSLVLQADQRAPERDVRDLTARAVDRIYNPAIAAGARLFAMFFAKETVLRKGRLQCSSQEGFRFAVGDGHGTLVRLPFHSQSAIE